MQNLFRRYVPAAFDDHVKLMYDLLALAFQADVTRVTTFMLAREASTRTYSHIGVPDPHHAISHHGNAPDKIEKHVKINAYHMKMFAYFLEKLKSTPDGQGSLLDHMTIVYGAGIADRATRSLSTACKRWESASESTRI